MDSVSVRYRWTLSAVREASRWHRQQFSRVRILPEYILLLGGILGFGFVAYVALRAGSLRHVWSSVFWPFYLILLGGLLWWIPKWRLKRSFSKSANRDVEVSWQITPAGLRAEHVDGSVDMKWSAFNKAVLTPTGLLLYPQPGLFHWLPRAGFDSEEGYKAVTAWARQDIKAFRALRSKDDKDSLLI